MTSKSKGQILSLLSTSEAAEALGVTREHVVHLCQEGKLQAQRKGKIWLIFPDSLAPHLAAVVEKGGRWSKGRKLETGKKAA